MPRASLTGPVPDSIEPEAEQPALGVAVVQFRPEEVRCRIETVITALLQYVGVYYMPSASATATAS